MVIAAIGKELECKQELNNRVHCYASVTVQWLVKCVLADRDLSKSLYREDDDKATKVIPQVSSL